MIRFITFVILATLGCASVVASCDHPDVKGRVFVVGYGSLMNRDSLNSTIQHSDAFLPVEVSGYERSFDALYDWFGLKSAMLSAEKKQSASLNAILIGIDDVDLQALDKREKGYCRQSVPPESVKFLSDFHNMPLDRSIWIYVPKEKNKSITNRKDYKLIQSYVDLFLGGCIAIEDEFDVKGFAGACINTTELWEQRILVNDRIYPRRPWVHQPDAMKIDQLLNKFTPETIQNRIFES